MICRDDICPSCAAYGRRRGYVASVLDSGFEDGNPAPHSDAKQAPSMPLTVKHHNISPSSRRGENDRRKPRRLPAGGVALACAHRLSIGDGRFVISRK